MKHHPSSGRGPRKGSPEVLALSRRRLKLLAVVWLLSLAGVAGRVAYLQTAKFDNLRQLGRRQQVDTVTLPASRGRIYDRAGRELASNVVRDSVYAVPRAIRDPEAFARRVGPVLGMDPAAVVDRVRRGGYFVWLARQIPPETAASLRELDLEHELGFEPEEKRVYPAGSLAAQVLGFTGVDSQGLAGVELFYDGLLRGHPGQAVRVLDALGREILERRVLRVRPRNGADVILTLDAGLQYLAERELIEAVERYRARWGVAIVMDVHTGALLAVVNVPRPDRGRSGVQSGSWRNRAVQDAYEPGSTFKLVTVAAALEAGVVRVGSEFLATGRLAVPGGRQIREAHGQAYGRLALVDVIRLSSNVAAAQIGARLGRRGFYDALMRFGFGRATGVDLPGESPGIVRSPGEWSAADPYVMAFGQGVAVTPLQLVRFVASLANGGYLVRPHVAAAVREPDGRLRRVAREERVRVLSSSVARALLRMMERAVTDGTGTAAAVRGYRVAGKTGTAQKPSPHGGYEPGRYVASFVGVVPADRPRLALAVVVDEPKGAYYGGVVAAPVFSRIASQALWMLGVPPSESTPQVLRHRGGD
ncbi:MAG: penicillin-binding protein 2 [Armatimonadota bacterium]|nr:penicillin-binding protein 2 [Armatimonadota bacterium]